MRHFTVALAMLFIWSLTRATSPPDATAYQITVNHAGVTASGGTLALQLTPRWTQTLSSPSGYPLIVGNQVYAVAGGLLYAFNIQTGAIVWGPIQVPSAVGVTYDAGTIFVVNASGLLSSFAAATGTPGWSMQLPGQYAFSSPPTASNGLVYVGGAGSGGTLYAVNETNGAVVWTAGVENGDNSSPAVGPNAVYVSYACLVTYSFDLTTGVRNWQNYFGCEGGGGETPVYANGKLYARDNVSGNDIFDAQTGTVLGSFASSTPPAIDTTTAYYLSSGTLTAVDLTTSAVRWSFAGDGGLTSAPVVVDQTVIIGSSSGLLYGLDEQTGRVTWQVNTGYSIPSGVEWFSTPNGFAVADGVLVVPAGNVLLAYSIFGPPAPTGLTAAGVAGGAQLSWSAAAGAATYNVYVSATPGAEPFTPALTGVTGTSVVVPGLTPCATYYFTVKAVSPAGISAASNEASALPIAVTPPTSVQSMRGVGTASLSWSASSNATTYNIYVGTAAGAESATAVATSITGTSALITGLIPGQVYYFVIKGVANGVLSVTSGEVSVIPATAAPPTMLAGSSEIGGAALTWGASAGAMSYQVYLGTTPGGEGAAPIQTAIAGTSTTITNLNANTPYYFVVRAYVNGIPSGSSNEISVTPQSDPGPQHVVLTPGVGQIALSWDASPAATQYDIFVGTASGKETPTPVQTVPGVQATLTGLSSDSTYYVYVQAKTPIGPSAPSPESSASALPPPGPTNVAVNPGINDVTLTWSAAAGATTYDVYEGTSAGGEGPTPVQTGISGLSTIVSGLMAATPYYFEVRAHTVNGLSVASAESSGSPLPAPGPTNLSGAAGVNDVTLTWSATPGATSYDIYEGTSVGGEGPTPVQMGISGLSSTVTGLTAGVPYYFEIRAQTADGITLASSEVTVTPTAASISSGSGGGGKGGGGALGGLDLLGLLVVAVAGCGSRLRPVRMRRVGVFLPFDAS